MIDYSDLLERNNIQHAIVGDVITSLPLILESFTKVKLNSLASLYELPGRSSMKKAELVEALTNYMTDLGVMEQILLIAEADELQLLESLNNNPWIQNNAIPYGDYAFLLDHGLVYTFFSEQKLYVVMPDEIKKSFTQIYNRPQFKKASQRRLEVLDYLRATTQLYGAIKLDKLVEIFNAQHDEPLSEGELWEYYAEYQYRGQRFEWDQGYFVSDALLDDEDELNELLAHVQGKPYYVPKKSELLKYADQLYFEMTPQLKALRDYILRELCNDDQMVEYIIDDIQLACSMEAPMNEIMYELERRDIVFDTMQQAETFVKLLIDVYNHTRLWKNAGHTPAELGRISGSHTHSHSNVVPFPTRTNQPVVSQKIGRNAPCPCGSGLKYKKCCGK